MKFFCKRRLAIAMCALAGMTSALGAEAFPSKPVRIVVTSAAGGLLDITTRLVARHMSDKLGQQVIVENRAGAGGLVALRAVKDAPADGYTLLAGVNTIVIQQVVSKEPGYDIVKDYVGIGPITRSPFLLVASPGLTDKGLADILSRAKSNPGKLTYASAGDGSTTHFAAALFAQRAGLDLVHVPYKGNAAAWPDVIAGRVGMIFEPYGSASPMLREGRLKALGVTSAKRLEVLPDVPTIAEQGVPSYNFYLWMGLVAPAGTPKDVVQKLSVALRSVLSIPEVRDRFLGEGSEVMSMSPDEFTSFLKSETSTLSKLFGDLGLPKQ